ncbi:MAG: NAD(P)-binding domain-containing protein [Gammaproteobacteria bacterium]|nr:NAD(P)-binding domain-containing protein [Gammaproteobacteria bacterium]
MGSFTGGRPVPAHHPAEGQTLNHNALDTLSVAVYAIPMTLILMFYIYRVRRQHTESLRLKNEAVQAGLNEPASLHPLIDPVKCTGCGACISACPEQPEHKVLGLIHGKAELISPTDCIGHGACFTACPHDANKLVFGTATRGIDIPHLKPNFETNVGGIFIAGELGGMGLIRNAIEQGRQAIGSICKQIDPARPNVLDLLIVGAGPAGFSASLSAMERGLRFVTVEQDSLGGTVAHYPRGKIVMTQPAVLSGVGKMPFRETSKEKLLEFWQQTEKETGLQINYNERLENISMMEQGFKVQTSRNTYDVQSILLAIGRRGTPRMLDIPGEELPKVTYRMDNPAQYQAHRVLVVGGGDSALEAACAIASIEGTEVTLSYRSGAFSRAKPKNRLALEQAESQGRLNVLLNSNVRIIAEAVVELEQHDKRIELPNDSVIISAGGILPTPFLRSIGINVETKFGTA